MIRLTNEESRVVRRALYEAIEDRKVYLQSFEDSNDPSGFLRGYGHAVRSTKTLIKKYEALRAELGKRLKATMRDDPNKEGEAAYAEHTNPF